MNKNSLFFILLFYTGLVSAQIEFTQLQDVFDYADQHHTAIQSSKMTEQMAVAAQKESRSFLYPTLSGSAGYQDNITLQPTLVPANLFNPAAPDGQFQELTFGNQYLLSTSFQAQWDVLNFQKIFAMQTADINLQSSQWNTEIQRYQSYQELASIYYSILLTKASLKIYKENLQLSTDILESTQNKVDKGLLSDTELNLALINQHRNAQALVLAENNLKQFHLQLQAALNITDSISIQDSLNTNVIAQTESIFPMHVELKQQALEIEKYESILKQKKALYLPSMSLFYQYNLSWATNNFSDFNRLPQQLFGVKMTVPIFSGFARKQQIQQSNWDLKMRRLQRQHTEIRKDKEDELLALELKQAKDRLNSSQEIWNLQKKNDAHSENKYQAGLINLDKRLQDYGELLAAQDAYLQSLAVLTLAQYKIYIRQIDFNIR